MASRTRSGQAGGSGDSSAPRRNSGEMVAQYTAGKKFKVKCLGNQEMYEFRPGDPAAKEIIRKLRQDSSRLKNKVKATVTLQLRELTVYDEKVKAISLSVPIRKVKFVCHDHQDHSVFAIIIQVERPDSVGYKLYCFQAEQKVSVALVRSLNEVFQLVHKIMQARRQQTQQAQVSTSQPGRKESKDESGSPPPEDPPVLLGFGIPAPPPSYKAAISHKNNDKYRKPDGVQTAPVILAPPPKSSPPTSSGRSRPQPTPTPRQQSVPSLPSLGPPPGSRPVPRPRGSVRQTSQEQITTTPAPPTAQAWPTATPPAQSIQPTTLAPPAQAWPTATPPAQSIQPTTPAPPTAQAWPTATPPAQSIQPTTPPQFANTDGPGATGVESAPQPQGTADVWGEWRSLEGELQTLAQEVGIDMSSNAGNSFDGQVNFSPGFDEDPFADNFFHTSFGNTIPAHQENSGADDIFASFSETPQPMAAQTDPFSSPVSLASASNNQPSQLAFEDPFASPVITGSSQIAPLTFPTVESDQITASSTSTAPVTPLTDPFSSITTSTASASGAIFEGENDFGSNFATSETPLSAVLFQSNFSEPPVPTSVPQPVLPQPPPRQRPSSRSSGSNGSALSITASSFDAGNFSELSIPMTTSAPILEGPVLSPPPKVQSSLGSSVAPSPVQATPVPFESVFSEPPKSPYTSPSLPPNIAPTPEAATLFEADFFQPANIPSTTSAPAKQGPLLAGPPSKPRGSRSRGKVSDSVTNTTVPQQSSFQAPSDSINSDLFSLQTTNSVFQPEAPAANATAFAATQAIGTQPNFPIDLNWSVSDLQPQTTINLQAGPVQPEMASTFGIQSLGYIGTAQQSFPGDPGWGGNNFQQQAAIPQAVAPQQSFPAQVYGQGNVFQDSAQAMYQFPVQEPPVMRAHPPQMDSGIYSPPQTNSFMSDQAVDMPLNPFAGDFSSPPFAIHSSTPQTPGQGGINGYAQHPSASPPAPPPRAVINGPDPFAELLPLALSPSKEASKKIEEPQAPPATINETPKTTQPKPQPKRPSLNDLYKEKHSFKALSMDTEEVSKIVSINKEPEQSFGGDFGTANSSSSSWIAF